MAKLTPFIRSEDARAQATFYTQALSGGIHWTIAANLA